jgi:hypothetical protein
MKAILISLLISFTLSTSAQTTPPFDGHKWQAPYHLPTPKDWGIERFLLPASFAPGITYKGVEDIRFMPGWANAKSNEYWSYTFLWYLDGKVETTDTIITNNLKAYYTGLISVNGKNIPAEKLIPVETAFKPAINMYEGDVKTFDGSVTMTDYMQQKKITLNAKVHLQYCAGKDKTFIFYELSPQWLTDAVWQKLDAIWSDFSCQP